MGMKATETRGRPATGITPKRYFRMSDEDYELIKCAAERMDLTISDYIRTVLTKNSKSVLKRLSE